MLYARGMWKKRAERKLDAIENWVRPFWGEYGIQAE